MTARVQKAFLSVFSSFLDLFDFFDLFADLARACLGFLERPSRSCEVVRVRMDRTIAHWAAPLDRETGPDLTWEWTLAVVVCGRP